MKVALVAIPLLFGLAHKALAHETTRSYLTIDRSGSALSATLRVAFRDIEVAVWIDEDLDGRITWGETQRRIDAVSNYVTSSLSFAADGPCEVGLDTYGVSEDAGIAYLDMSYIGSCSNAEASLGITTRLFVDVDPDHRLFLTAKTDAASTTAVLGAGESTFQLKR